MRVFFDSWGGPWTVCSCEHPEAEAFGPEGCARPLPGPQWAQTSPEDREYDEATGWWWLIEEV